MITCKGAEDTLGKSGQGGLGQSTADAKNLETAAHLRDLRLWKGVGIDYEPWRQKTGEMGGDWIVKDSICNAKMFRLILREMEPRGGYYRVRQEKHECAHCFKRFPDGYVEDEVQDTENADKILR